MLFNLFKHRAQSETEPSGDQAVIIDIDFAGLDNFGTKEQRDEIRVLEEKIERNLPNGAEVDGDEFGDGTCTIYTYGPSADKIFAAIKSLLKSSDFTHIDITLQYGRPEDPSTKDKKFTL